MASDKSLVLVIGATGYTGKSIVQGLLQSGNFRVAALVRPASVSKPATEALRAFGVEIRIGDVKDDYESLKKTLDGVDVLISSVVAWVIGQQKDIFRAAKEVGVKRVIPCDFATPGAKGIRVLHDSKLAIRDFVKELGVPYTFIDVGWWMQLYFPLPSRSTALPSWKRLTNSVYGDGTNATLLTNLDHIGTFVARIVSDPRTLNKAVIVWETQATQIEAHEIAERISGDGEVLKAQRSTVTAENLLALTAEGEELIKKDPKNVEGLLKRSRGQYMYSMHILQENTLENAKRLGYLDVRELYPDIPVQSLEEYAKEFYAMEEPGEFYSRESS